MISDQLKQATELKANLIKDIEQKITELKELIIGVKSVYPDYQSPLDVTPSSNSPSTGGTLIYQLFDYLSTDSVKRVNRKMLLAKFCPTFTANGVDNALTQLIKTSRVVNGYIVKEIHPPEDTYRSFIKVKAS